MLKKMLLAGMVLLTFIMCSKENPLEKQKVKSYIPELVQISKDLTFTMGCLYEPDWFGFFNEAPPFKVILSPYYIGKYEVRNDEFKYFVDDHGYRDSTLWSENGWTYIQSEKRTRPINWIVGNEPWINRPLSNTPDRPVNSITWYEAEAYCNWLSRQTGECYSLPTEAQWERAARGPDPGRIFTWGNQHDKSFYNNIMYSSKLYPVGYYKQDITFDGCYDMAGNILEFCTDLYEIYIYQKYKEKEPVYNPAGPDTNKTGQRALRGSIAIFYPDPDIEYQITTFRRMCCNPGYNSQIYGFRVVKSLNE